MSDLVRRARIHAAANGGNEPRAINTNIGLEELFNRRQELILAMNQAKLKAIEEAVKPFQDAITEIDQQYSMMLMMIGNNSEELE